MDAVRKRLENVPINGSAARLMDTIGSGQRTAPDFAAILAGAVGGGAGATSGLGLGGEQPGLGPGLGGLGGLAGAMGQMMGQPSLATAAMSFMQNINMPSGGQATQPRADLEGRATKSATAAAPETVATGSTNSCDSTGAATATVNGASGACTHCGCLASGAKRGEGGGAANASHSPSMLAAMDDRMQANFKQFRQQLLDDVQQMHTDLLQKILEQTALR